MYVYKICVLGVNFWRNSMSCTNKPIKVIVLDSESYRSWSTFQLKNVSYGRQYSGREASMEYRPPH